MRRTHTVTLVTGPLHTGYWCNACMTSGGIRFSICRLHSTGVTQVATAQACTTCGGPGDLEDC